jgi:hypothetical protein
MTSEYYIIAPVRHPINAIAVYNIKSKERHFVKIDGICKEIATGEYNGFVILLTCYVATPRGGLSKLLVSKRKKQLHLVLDIGLNNSAVIGELKFKNTAPRIYLSTDCFVCRLFINNITALVTCDNPKQLILYDVRETTTGYFTLLLMELKTLECRLNIYSAALTLDGSVFVISGKTRRLPADKGKYIYVSFYSRQDYYIPSIGRFFWNEFIPQSCMFEKRNNRLLVYEEAKQSSKLHELKLRSDMKPFKSFNKPKMIYSCFSDEMFSHYYLDSLGDI